MAPRRVILILIDGLKFETAVSVLSFMEGLVARGSARRWAMRCALPSLSRPMYETILTGLAPQAHGILANETSRPSSSEHIFAICRRNGRVTAASAYGWISELYNGEPYSPEHHHTRDDDALVIPYGRYYHNDDYPDADVFAHGRALAQDRTPDFLLVHPMGCDHAGHTFGGRSRQYTDQANVMNTLLAEAVPAWLDAGYAVLVTADHGMDDHGHHGGPSDDECLVPFYAAGCGQSGVAEGEGSSLSIAPTVLSLMQLPRPSAMAVPALF